MDIINVIAKEISVKTSQVKAAVTLMDEGNTVPFISRYRKEVTGSLNDEQLRTIEERLVYLRNLEEKKETVIKTITEQEKMTEELKTAIDNAMTLVELEDIYRPYKPKKRTRAMIAKEKGLEGLANIIILQMTQIPIEEEAKKYISTEKEVEDEKAAIEGAKDIIAESIADNTRYRQYIRDYIQKNGTINSQAKNKEEESVYEMYYEFEEKISKIPGYRVLAINRGEKEKILQVKIVIDEERITSYLEKQIITRKNEYTGPILEDAIKDSYKRLIFPAVEREIRSQLTQNAESKAVKVFGENLKQLLLQPPIAGRVVMGWDPAFRTGCKLAVVDETGKVLYTKVIFPTQPQNKIAESEKILEQIIKKYNVSLISIGNGTASRESEQVVSDFIKKSGLKVEYVIVNEAGASVYSASKLATEEFPEFDVGQRSAVSIARRLQDPLAELVKIPPESIGVGQYQHDINQKHLAEALEKVVEDNVNKVGVDLNTASASLLMYVSGISKSLANNIVIYREENGKFKNRKELLKVSKLGPKAFLQSAGFMRISDGTNLLDMTSVHPESYEIAEKIIKKAGLEIEDLKKGGIKNISSKLPKVKELSKELEIGEETLTDIIKELEKPARDPRDEMPKPILRTDVLSIEDLKEGMILKGTVRNVMDFGAFVDIGVHQDGLVHISQMSEKFIKHPLEAVSIGDIVEVKILGVDVKKHRIQLTMKM
ncbi:uncharacterized protein SAMN05216249_10346 [Acetitomaculum ruminis DSM 5522]|uniref:S1 motif domain-containing protein n=1 Tax=Acetitomaculum ruminis DSM 5522 TaxID=1120918 RepID=A0A1I0W318_9FIRM|nr:Tex family protein [Acetitomaculum ruminis]SFA83011.1 uncharacterized protein SAMN05216249_10346 [Acetitomaculum ruminis DSM 5522]